MRIIILSVNLFLTADALLDVDPQLLALSLEPLGVISKVIHIRVTSSYHLRECAYLLDKVNPLPPETLHLRGEVLKLTVLALDVDLD